MNIVWKKPDESLAVTWVGNQTLALMEAISTNNGKAQEIFSAMRLNCTLDQWMQYNGISVEEHAYKLKEREPQYVDWVPVGFGVEIPTDRSNRNGWRWVDGKIQER